MMRVIPVLDLASNAIWLLREIFLLRIGRRHPNLARCGGPVSPKLAAALQPVDFCQVYRARPHPLHDQAETLSQERKQQARGQHLGTSKAIAAEEWGHE